MASISFDCRDCPSESTGDLDTAPQECVTCTSMGCNACLDETGACVPCK